MKIGVDIGGQHVAVGLVENENLIVDKSELYSAEDREHIEDAIVEKIVREINEILEENNVSIDQIESIGIGSPGTISNGTIVKAGNLGLKDFNLLDRLKEHFDKPMHLRNDGKCAALAEKAYGSLKDYDDALFLNIGTGVGGAAFLGGKLLEPKRYSGFEFGHMVIEKDGIECTCGKKGCFERYASIKSLKNKVVSALNLEGDISGRYMRENLLDMNNPEINKIVNEFLDSIVLGINNLIDIFEPEIICFGGSFSYYEGTEIFENYFKSKYYAEKGRFNEGEPPKLVMASFKNNAGIIGATID